MAIADRTPDAPRRGPKPKFTRTQIVVEGLRLIAEDGVAGLNLRALADRMPMTVMGLYRYFADKEDLLDAIVAHALAPVIESDCGDGPRARLEHAMRSFYTVLLENPGLAELCAARFPGEQADDLRAHLRAIAGDTGLPTAETRKLLRALTSFVMGSAIVTPVQADRIQDQRAAFHYGLARLLSDIPNNNPDEIRTRRAR